MLVALASVLLLLAPAPRDEFRERLAQLSAPRAAERESAERWLQAHLVLERYAELAEAALGADAEVRGRLARVLASDGRFLALALALAIESDARLAELGRDAVRTGVARADPRLAAPALRDGVDSLLRRLASPGAPRALRLEDHLSLEATVDALERGGELPLGLTLDARVASAIRREEGPLIGSWNEILADLERGFAVEVHGLERGHLGDDPEGAFLRIASKTDPVRTGVEVVAEWLLVLARSDDEPARRRAACNLAASGFVPALEWMDELVRTRDDGAALEGLLLAAARGRVGRSLLEPRRVSALLREAETEGGPRSGWILQGLAHAGCATADGAELFPPLLAEFAAASPRARWTRLFLLERNGCASPEARALARSALLAGATPPVLRLQALRALAALGGDPSAPLGTVPDLGRILALSLDATELEGFGRALARLDLAPPYPDPAGIPEDWSAAARSQLLELWLWQARLGEGAAQVPAAHLAAWLRRPEQRATERRDALVDTLDAWLARGAEPLLGRVLDEAAKLDCGPPGALERLRLLLRLVPPEEVPAQLRRLGIALDASAPDLSVLAALVGYPEPLAEDAMAREALLALLGAAMRDNRPPETCRELVDALRRAAWRLYRAGRDEVGDSFSMAVRQSPTRPKSALAASLSHAWWPPWPDREQHALARELRRFEVPASL